MFGSRITVATLVGALLLGSAAPAFARPTVIAQLGTAPLLGQSSSTRQLQERVAQNRPVLSAAAKRLGLNADQFAQFDDAIASGRVAWVTVPRHLDAMTWRAGSHVYAIHDVVIPARTRGWEVDLPTSHGTLAVYMPATCGNMSILRKAARAVARVSPARVIAAPAPLPPAPPPPAPPPPPPPPPVAAAAPPAAPPIAAAPPVPVTSAPAATESEFPPAPAVSHHLRLLPILLGAAALAGFSTSGGGGCP